MLAGSSAWAQTSMVVLTLPASARAAGGGDAAPFATDASALFYGAQHLPRARAVAASAGTWLGDAQLASIAFSTPVAWQRRAQTVVALGVQSLNYGSVDEIVPDPLTGGTRGVATGNRVSGNELAVTLGLSQGTARQRIGAAMTYMRQSVADLSASAVTLSAATGITVRGWDADYAGAHASASRRDPSRRTLAIPTTHRLSVATPPWGPRGARWRGARWRGVAEARRISGEGTTTLAGVEATFHSTSKWTVQARGAALAYTKETARAPWTVGGSAARGAWAVDYGYQGFGALGAVHRMGVTWRATNADTRSR